MPPETGLTRSSINLRGEPNLTSHVIEILDPQEPVQLDGEAQNMLLVHGLHRRPNIQGYTLKSSVLRVSPSVQAFPRLDIGGGIMIASVPSSLPLAAFLTWLESAAESPWLPADYLEAIRSGRRPSVGASIRQSIRDHRDAWDAWISEIRLNGRQNSCSMDEWQAIVAGGREMWSFRTERLFAQPSQHGQAPAWVVPKDVLHWTGHVRFNDQELKYKLWYEVELTKLDHEFKGWYKAALLDEFVLPTPRTDLSVPLNKDHVFDLSRAPLRLPEDPEIAAAIKRERGVAQYIDVGAALGWAQIHHNLCGQFCVAALGATDVIPLLQKWKAATPKALRILQNDYGTSLTDLCFMLDMLKKPWEYFRGEGGIAPITPGYVRRKLDSGRMVLLGTGITGRGAIRVSSRTRHWVVVEDVLQVGNSGWVRLYNSFTNRDEVYPFPTVFGAESWSAFGLWIEPTHAPIGNRSAAPVMSAQVGPV